MRCNICDVELTDGESTDKNPKTGEYYDLCTTCKYEIVDTINDMLEADDVYADIDELTDWASYVDVKLDPEEY